MADAEATRQTEKVQDREVPTLKHLEFVHIAALHAFVLISSFYNFAKDNSGPLKPGVQTVEGTVKTVIDPVYEKFHGIPFDLLKFADEKVDSLMRELQKHVPVGMKEASSQAFLKIQRVPEVARSVSLEFQRAGIVDTAAEMSKAAYCKLQPVAKDLYCRYEPIAERCAVTAWRNLNRLPLFPDVAAIIVPTAAHWSEKYNKSVMYAAGRGYPAAAYLPCIPTERISKVFGEEHPRGTDGEVAGSGSSVAEE